MYNYVYVYILLRFQGFAMKPLWWGCHHRGAGSQRKFLLQTGHLQYLQYSIPTQNPARISVSNCCSEVLRLHGCGHSSLKYF